MSYGVWSLVIFLTALVVYLGPAWIMERADHKRTRLLAALDQANANVQLPRAGRLEGDWMPGPQWSTYAHQAFSGAADPAAYEVRAGSPIPWDLAGAAYALGQQRADQDAVSREVEAIFAEVEHNPERWQR